MEEETNNKKSYSLRGRTTHCDFSKSDILENKEALAIVDDCPLGVAVDWESSNEHVFLMQDGRIAIVDLSSIEAGNVDKVIEEMKSKQLEKRIMVVAGHIGAGRSNAALAAVVEAIESRGVNEVMVATTPSSLQENEGLKNLKNLHIPPEELLKCHTFEESPMTRKMRRARGIHIKPRLVGQPIKRNEKCHCGSGLKYKKCHGKND